MNDNTQFPIDDIQYDDSEEMSLENMFTNKFIPDHINLRNLCYLLSEENDKTDKTIMREWFFIKLKDASHVFKEEVWENCLQEFLEVLDSNGVKAMLHINDERKFVPRDKLISTMFLYLSKIEALDQKKNKLVEFGTMFEHFLSSNEFVDQENIYTVPIPTFNPNANDLYYNNPLCWHHDKH